MASGFLSPLFLLGLAAGSEADQGGFRQPLPVPPVAAVENPEQGGFTGPLPLVNLGAVEEIATPEAGGGSDSRDTRPGKQNDDEEVILMVIRKFLEMVGNG